MLYRYTYIVFYVTLIDYDPLGAAGRPIEVGKRFTVIQQHTKGDVVEWWSWRSSRITKEDVVGNEMVDLPPLMEPEEGKREEIEQAASESRHLADELAGMLDRLEIEEERSAAVNAAVLGEQEEVEEALKVGEHLYSRSLQIMPSIFIQFDYSFLITF